MLVLEKRVSETPLEALERLRRERPELAAETLSYAGRLDPMAEGAMIVLVGEEENRPESRAKFLSLDKEYVATFLVGAKTDTGDCLGLVDLNADAQPFSFKVESDRILEEVRRLQKITKQAYPWFSGKTVGGVELFDHFKAGNTGIERPEQDIAIKEADVLGFEERSMKEVKKYIIESIRNVRGDFRQREILTRWEDVMSDDGTVCLFRVRFLVSSGTFIRSLTEHFSVPVTLLSLNRTRILM